MQPFIIGVILLMVLVVLYLTLFRPWQLRWGATVREIERSMPGDGAVLKPSFNATRSVTINATAEAIYPWIVQMGLSRAGWYSFDLLDNLARKSAETILPQYQDLKIGDVVPMSPNGKNGLWVKDFRKNQWMLWGDKKGDSTWVWGIYAAGKGQCRLITRVRMKYRWLSWSLPFNLLIEFFDLPMMRKSMLGIKRRTESMAMAPAQS